MVRSTCKAPAKWNEYTRIQVLHLSSLCGPECVDAARSGEVVAHDAHATVGAAGDEELAAPQRAALHQHTGHLPAGRE